LRGRCFRDLGQVDAHGLLGARTLKKNAVILLGLMRDLLHLQAGLLNPGLKRHGPHEIANDASRNDAERYAYRDF
jgi:hypothetical protein